MYFWRAVGHEKVTCNVVHRRIQIYGKFGATEILFDRLDVRRVMLFKSLSPAKGHGAKLHSFGVTKK